MSKYIQLFSLYWQNGLVYRTNLILWRFRQFLSALMALTVWSVVFTGQEQVFGYDTGGMIAYVFIASFLQSLVLATALHGLAQRVYSGEVSMLLTKPINFFGTLAIEDLADKSRNILFIFVEMGLLYLLFMPTIPLPGLQTWLIFGLLASMGAVLHFIISLLFGTLGFFSPETWGPKFLFFVIVDFTAGKLFPLDILPEVVQKILFLTPFPYFSFVQTQVFLEKYTQPELLNHILVLAGWLIGLSVLNSWLWKKGMREYTAAGH
ncbi:MAG: ABC-2 family transporter protein [Patescibacteria group bacterium]